MAPSAVTEGTVKFCTNQAQNSRQVWPESSEKAAQSIWAPDALIIGAHFASSALTSSLVASGVLPGVGSIPAFSSAEVTAGSASDLLMAVLSLSTIGFGVPAGARNTFQV